MVEAGTILIADDSRASLILLQRGLGRLGYDIVTSESGQQALQLADEHEIDIFVLDVQMPGLSGFDTARALHAKEKYRETPIIFLTGEEDIQQRIKGFDAGGVDYIIKPFHTVEVAKRVGIHLELFRRRRESERYANEMEILANERAKQLALRRLPPRMRAQLFKLGGTRLSGLVEAQTRFGGIDMSRTQAFSEELSYFPSVWLNIEGRDPAGAISPSDVAAVRREVQSVLMELRDPFSGRPVVRRVTPREELYDGPYLDRAPDLILELHLDGGYSYNLMPTASAGANTGPWRRLAETEKLGRKGRSMPGSHRDRGLFVASGPSVAQVGEVDAAIADVAATLLARMQITIPPELAGRVLWELFAETIGSDAPTIGGELPSLTPPHREATNESGVPQRLRALGYID